MKLGSTRQAIHDALCWGWQQRESSMVQYLTYLTRIEKSIKASEPCGDFLEAAYICAAINTIQPHLGGWLKFAYGTDDSGLIEGALASKLRFDLFPVSNAKKHGRLLALATTSLEDYRLRLWRARDMPDAVYCERMGVLQPNFYRDGWGDKKDACLDSIRDWDKEGVGQVSRMVKMLRGERYAHGPSTADELLKDLANDKV